MKIPDEALTLEEVTGMSNEDLVRRFFSEPDPAESCTFTIVLDIKAKMALFRQIDIVAEAIKRHLDKVIADMPTVDDHTTNGA